MSQKKVKQQRKEEMEDLKNREQKFMETLDKASKEYKIGLFPVLQYTPNGVMPAMRLIDESKAKTQEKSEPEIEP